MRWVKGCWLAAGAALVALAAAAQPPDPLNLFVIDVFALFRAALVVLGVAVAGVGAYLREARLRRLSVNVIVLGVAALVSLVLLEAILRVAVHDPQGFIQRDTTFDHSGIPNVETEARSSEYDVRVRTNGLGLRGPEVGAKDRPRVLMLGDSFTFGHGVEEGETFSAQAARILREQGYDVEVINAGMLSYSPTTEYLYLRDRGRLLAPDVIVVNYDMSDMQDDYLYSLHAIYNDDGTLDHIVPPAEGRSVWEYRTLGFVKSVLKQVYFLSPPTREAETPLKYDIARNRYALTLERPMPQEDWERSFTYLRDIHAVAEELNASMLLVMYPLGHQVNGREWDLGRHNYGFAVGKTYDEGTPDLTLAAFAREEGIPFLDMFPVFRNETRAPLYLRYDGHFTPLGHLVYAEALAPAIEQALPQTI